MFECDCCKDEFEGYDGLQFTHDFLCHDCFRDLCMHHYQDVPMRISSGDSEGFLRKPQAE
jgi:hypothetical protein